MTQIATTVNCHCDGLRRIQNNTGISSIYWHYEEEKFVVHVCEFIAFLTFLYEEGGSCLPFMADPPLLVVNFVDPEYCK